MTLYFIGKKYNQVFIFLLKEKALSSRTPRSQEKDYDSLLRRSYGAQDWEPTETDAPKYITQSCRLERQVEDLIPGLQHLRVDKVKIQG